jgi:hypothetical protein
MSIHPDDPLSARHFIEYEMTGGRDGQMYHTRSEANFTSDADHFYPSASLKCWLNEELVFEREWKDKIPRNLV